MLRRPGIALALALSVLAAGLANCTTDPAAGPGSAAGSGSDSGDGGAPRADAAATDGGFDGSGEGGPRAFCRSSGDCPDGELCSVDRTGEQLRRRCRAPEPEEGRRGDACTSDGECASKLCLEGACTKPCTRPAQCAEGWTCEPTDIPTERGGTETVEVCRPDPSKECLSDGDCTENEICMARRGSDSVGFRCGDPPGERSSAGESCSSDADCLHDLCVDGECASPCDSERACPDGLTCLDSEVDLGGDSSETVSLCRTPSPCSRAAECRADDTCVFERDRTGEAGSCRPPNSGNRQLGDACSGDDQCPAHLCHDGRFRTFCSVPCRNDSDCSEPGFRCETRDVPDDSGGVRSVDICVPSPPSACSNPSDCAPNRTCAVVVQPDGTGLESVCLPDNGGRSTGDSCTADTDCKGRICLGGRCSTPCDARSQCASDQLCRSNPVGKNGESGSFRLCETPPDEKCTSSGTCPDPVRVCSDLRTNMNNEYDAFCQFPNANAPNQLGESCSKDGDCASGLCLGDLPGSPLPDRCSVVCRGDNQCAAGQICTSVPSSPGSDVAICTKPCGATADCSGSNTCQINENRLTTPRSADTICAAPPGTKQFGATCSGGGGCESGLCLTSFTFDPTDPNDQRCTPGSGSCPTGWGCHRDSNRNNDYYCADEQRRCTELCRRDSDCGGVVSGDPLDSCSRVDTTLSDGTTTQIDACASN